MREFITTQSIYKENVCTLLVQKFQVFSFFFLELNRSLEFSNFNCVKEQYKKKFLRLGQLLISCLLVFLSILRIKLICEVSNDWRKYLCSIIFMGANAVASTFMTYFPMLHKQIYVNCVTHFPS